ncbi:MAG: hypothetical protein ABL984_07530 [Pyrinomonadaceae bacterium]
MYTIEYQPTSEYLRADVKGDLAAPQIRVDAWSEIIRRCRGDAVTHLLVVQDSPGNGTETNAFVSSDGIVGLGLKGIKIAYVDIDPANHEVNKFGEMVASNRGAEARVFYQEEPALAWLLSKDSI